MIKETTGRRMSAKSDNMHAAVSKNVKDGFATIEAFLPPPGSPERAAAGIAVAAGGALLVAVKFGARPAALAMAAGYLAYCAIYGSEKTNKAGLSLIRELL